MAQTDNPVKYQLLLVVSRALRALGTPLVAYLMVQAATISSVMVPVTFCNVLFVGNLCASLVVLSRFGVTPIAADLRKVSGKLLFGLIVNGCLAALLSALIFSALRFTTVTNTVLLGRLGPVIYAIAGAVFFQNKIHKPEWAGFGLIVAGVLVMSLQSSMFQLSIGDLLIIASSFVYAASATISKKMLSGQCSLRLVVFSRNFVSAFAFAGIAIYLFGPMHFQDVLTGSLWIIMAVYALFVIVLSQFAWFASLRKLDSTTVAKWTVLSPVFGIVYAFLINGERPTVTQVIAFAIIMLGVSIGNLGKLYVKGMSDSMENSLAAS
ncbi:MAG: DMT family transporter [Cyanobacteria bacterium P01_A01_bin.3]